MTAKKAKFYAVNELNIGGKSGLKTVKAGAPIDFDLSAEDQETLTSNGSIETVEQYEARRKRAAEHADAVAEADRLNREGRTDLPGGSGGDARPFTRSEVPGLSAGAEKKLAEAGDGGAGKNTGSDNKATP